MIPDFYISPRGIITSMIFHTRRRGGGGYGPFNFPRPVWCASRARQCFILGGARWGRLPGCAYIFRRDAQRGLPRGFRNSAPTPLVMQLTPNTQCDAPLTRCPEGPTSVDRGFLVLERSRDLRFSALHREQSKRIRPPNS